MILGKINVARIEKGRLFRGTKGTYLDIVLIETPNDQYGNDYMIVQGVSQDERKAGVKGAILGNAKVRESKPRSDRGIADTAPTAGGGEADEQEEMPF